MNMKHDNCAVKTDLFYRKSWFSCTGNTFCNNTKHTYECLNIVFLFHCFIVSLFYCVHQNNSMWIKGALDFCCYTLVIPIIPCFLHPVFYIIPCFCFTLYIPLLQLFGAPCLYYIISCFCYTLYIPLFHVFVTPSMFHYSMYFLLPVLSLNPWFCYTLYIQFFRVLLHPVYCIIPCFVKPCIFHYSMFLGHLYIPLFHLFVKPIILHYSIFFNILYIPLFRVFQGGRISFTSTNKLSTEYIYSCFSRFIQ